MIFDTTCPEDFGFRSIRRSCADRLPRHCVLAAEDDRRSQQFLCAAEERASRHVLRSHSAAPQIATPDAPCGDHDASSTFDDRRYCSGDYSSSLSLHLSQCRVAMLTVLSLFPICARTIARSSSAYASGRSWYAVMWMITT